KRAAVRRVIGIALNVDHLRRDVLRFVANRVDEHAATDRAVRTSRARFAGSGDFQFFEFGVSGLEVKSEDGSGGTTDCRNFEEISAGCLHRIRASQDSAPLPNTELFFCVKVLS